MSGARSPVAALGVAVSLLAVSFAWLATPAAAAPPTPLAIYPLDPIPGLEYVAVAPRNLADSLKPLIDWKTEKGVPAQVFVLEDILLSYPARLDDAEGLHDFLRDLYFGQTGGTAKWLLLVGDGDWDNPRIPLREVFANSQQDGLVSNSGNWYTTDTYYGNLESNWNEDGDAIFGELNEGDWTPEMYVGRVPVETPAQVAQWVARQVTYEKNPPAGLWMRRAVLAGALMDRPNILDNIGTRADEGYDPFTDNARKVDEEVAAEAPPWMEIDRIYDYPFWEGGRYTTATDDLVPGAVKNAIDIGAAFVLMEGHGYTSNTGVASYGDPSGTAPIFRDDGEEPALRYDEVYNLTNGPMLPFVYVSACYAGDFTDRDDTSFEAFLKAPGGGAIAVVAGNGENYRLENVSGQQGFGNWWLAREFFHMLFEEGYSQPGKVLGDLKQRYHDYYTSEGPTDAVSRNYFRAERVSYNLMGDPEFSIITDVPAGISAAPVRQPYVGESTVQVQVTGRGGALPGALVHITGRGGDSHGRTNAAGLVTLAYNFADLSQFNLTVTAPNHALFGGSFAPAVPDHNLAFEPSALHSTGPVRRGDPVTVSGTVVARGISPYTNVAVEFRTGNPTNGTVVGAAAIATLAPGAAALVSATLSFDASGDFLVYATIDPAGGKVEDTRADNVAYAAVHVNYPPEFAPLPSLSVPAGGALANAFDVFSYLTDRDDGALAISYRVKSVSDPSVTALFAGSKLGLTAGSSAPPSVTVTLEASDALESTEATLTVAIAKSNLAPVIDPLMDAQAFVGEPFVLQLSAADPEGRAVVWSDSSALFEIQANGRIAFTPTADEVGRYAVTVTASDGQDSSSHTFLLVISKRTTGVEVHNLPVVRASAGHPVVIDLNAISPDPSVTFITDRQDVTIDSTNRLLRYTPAPGPARLDSIRLTAAKAGGPSTVVIVNVDVAGPPSAGGDVVWFAGAGLALAAVVALTLLNSHKARLRDERNARIFKVKGRPPKKPSSRSPAGTLKDEAASKRGSREDE